MSNVVYLAKDKDGNTKRKVWFSRRSAEKYCEETGATLTEAAITPVKTRVEVEAPIAAWEPRQARKAKA